MPQNGPRVDCTSVGACAVGARRNDGCRFFHAIAGLDARSSHRAASLSADRRRAGDARLGAGFAASPRLARLRDRHEVQHGALRGSGGAALLLPTRGVGARVAQALAMFVAAFGGLTLFEHLTGASFGIDTLFFDEPPGALATAAP